MRKRITVLMVAALLALTMAFAMAAPAFAASPAEAECAAGGTYEGQGGQKTCVLPPEPTNPGNPQSGNANEPFTTNTTTQQTGAGGGGGEQQGPDTSTTTNPGGHEF
jgi:hypothetical protein